MYRMEDGRIPKDLLYGELESGSRPIGRPKLRFKDVCKRDMLATGLPTDNWELHAADRSDWRSVCSHERKCLSQLRYSWTWSDDCLLLLLIHEENALVFGQSDVRDFLMYIYTYQIQNEMIHSRESLEL